MSHEVEYKFSVPQERLAEVEAALQAKKAERIEMRAHYYDTEDGRLAAAQIGLRLRQENERWVQTVKGPGQGPIARLEHEVVLNVEDSGGLPTPRIERHEGSPAFALLRDALPDPAVPLLSMQGTQMTRLRSLQTQGASRIELALDVGEVTARDAEGQQRRSPVCELELELVEGRLEDLRDLAQLWAQRHGLVLSTLSKAERGLRLMRGQAAGEAVKAQPMTYAKDETPDGTAIQRAVVANCLAQILPNASEVAQGNTDVDVVHQLRVGTRRLRTALRTLQALHPGNFRAEWEAPLTAVFRALGEDRDDELLRTRIQPQLQAAGGPALTLAPLAEAPALDGVVAHPDFQAVLITLIAFSSGAALQDRVTDAAALDSKAARTLLARRLGALHRKVRKGGKTFTALSPEDQHRVRKQLKRLRYLAEFVGTLFGRKAARRYLQRLTPAQDTLGVYNDHQVALSRYRRRAADDPRALFAVGWLSATLPSEAAQCQKDLGRIRTSDRFWKC